MDAVTALWDGTRLDGAADLRKALLARSPQFAETVAEKLLAYGLGRKVEYHDMPLIRSIVSTTRARNYRLRDLIKAMASSPQFQRRVRQPTSSDPLVAQEH